ncbi:MAG: TrwC9 [Blastococcus sp.]|nr:TrwC9 [Blastococcus sp.]
MSTPPGSRERVGLQSGWTLLTVADECQVHVALLGDRHQLTAVGRGGVLDLAARQVDPTAHLTLDAVHRFTRTDATGRTVPDSGYADLTLAMRRGEDPGAVFDALAARGQIHLHPDPASLQDTIAATPAPSAETSRRPARSSVAPAGFEPAAHGLGMRSVGDWPLLIIDGHAC